MKTVTTYILFLCALWLSAQPTNIDIGLFNNSANNSLEVRIIPDADYDGLYAGVVFTLKWSENLGLTLSDPDRNAVGDFAFVMRIRKAGEVFNNNGFNYQKFSGETTTMLSDESLQFSNGQEFLICAIPYSQTSLRGEISTRANDIEISNDGTVNSNQGSHYQEVGDGVEVTGIIYQPGFSFSVLPITLTSFTAREVETRAVQLDWTSEIEVNSSHFIVQRSDDGEDFEDIGRIEAAVNSNTKVDYSYLDRDLIIQRNSSRVIYYRLHQIDQDGFSEFSEVRAVRLDRLGFADVTIYPNPTTDQLHLDLSEDLEETIIQYEIHDAQGRLVKSNYLDISVQKLHLLRLQEMGLQSGVYFIKLRNNSEVLTSQKFVLLSR